jgi:hypothetical protein
MTLFTCCTAAFSFVAAASNSNTNSDINTLNGIRTKPHSFINHNSRRNNVFSKTTTSLFSSTSSQTATSSSSSSPPRVIPTVINMRGGDEAQEETNLNEKREADSAWNTIKNTCSGCWSGSIAHFEIAGGSSESDQHPTKFSQSFVPSTKSPTKLNFRLKVEMSDDDMDGEDEENFSKNEKGIWTVNNVMYKGDTMIIPIAAKRDDKATSHKIAFENGTIIRTTKKKCVYTEIGFWHDSEAPMDSGSTSISTENVEKIRKTIVTAFTNLSASPTQPQPKKMIFDELLNLSCVNQKFLGTANPDPEGFVGHSEDITDDGNLNFMPDYNDEEAMEAMDLPFLKDEEDSIHGSSIDDMVPLKTESIDLVTYEREVNDNLSSTQMKDIQQRILQHLKDERNNPNSVTAMTPPGVLVSLPKKFDKEKDVEKFYYANLWKNGLLQVAEIVYSTKPSLLATKITVYTFQDTKKKTV